MKTLFFFSDTETTGLFFDYDQVISYALILQDKEKLLLEEDVYVKLKKNIFPNPKALLVNNLNPFSDTFKNKQKTQFDAVMYFKDTILKYKKEGYRIVFIAYNAEFDINMFKIMLEECGVNFDALIDFSYDPLITAKKMVQTGVLETREVDAGYGKTYKSSKLEDVYNALGYSSKDITAHNALEDTKMLKTACMKLYLLFAGKSLDEAEVDLSSLSFGDIKKYVYSEGLDLVFKTGIIIDSNQFHIKFLEYDKLKENHNKNFIDSFEILEKNKIFDEILPESKVMRNLFTYLQGNKDKILNAVQDLNFPAPVLFFSEETLYFGKIEKLLEEKNKDINFKIEDEELNKKVENLSLAKDNKSWATKDNDFKSIFYNFKNIQIEMSKKGVFILKIDDQLIIETLKKTEILDLLVEKQIVEKGSQEYKDISKNILPIKGLKNPKHPDILIEEFNLVKEDVFKGGNALHKDILKGLKEHYQENSDMFSKLSIPNFKLDLSIFKKK